MVVPTPRALVVDFGGVLTTPLQASFAAFAEREEIGLDALVRVALRAYTDEGDDLVTGFETGRIEEDDFCRRFAERLHEETGKNVDPNGLVDRIFGHVSIEPTVVDAVAGVRRGGFKTALLSNSWGLRGYPRDSFEELFDVVVISGEVGLRKPDPEIFRLTSRRLDVPPEQTVFVDDHPGHLKAAQIEGMVTVLHRDPGETVAEIERLFGVSLRDGASGSS